MAIHDIAKGGVTPCNGADPRRGDGAARAHPTHLPMKEMMQTMRHLRNRHRAGTGLSRVSRRASPRSPAIVLGLVVVALLLDGGTPSARWPSPSALFPAAWAAQGARIRIFVASETTNSVWVFENAAPEPIAKIPAGHHPHNLGLSPDGQWVATAARESDEVSLIDAVRLVEVARVRLGRAPHDVVFSPDGRRLYVSQEDAPVISVIDMASRRRLPSLQVGVPQHDLAITPDGRELWLAVTAVTMRQEPRRLWVVGLPSGKVVAKLDTGRNAHDVIFTPDGKEAWVTNSGIIGVPDDHMTVLDVGMRRVTADYVVGRYPFHSPKAGRDARYAPKDPRVLWFSDHGLRAIVAVNRQTGKVVSVTPVGKQPYHIAPAPNGWLYVAANASDWVAVVDPVARKRIGVLRVPRPHGVAVMEVR